MHHVKKHHKKYIFAAGTAVGIAIIKIVAIVALFFGITVVSEKFDVGDQKLAMCEAVNIFYQIDEIADLEIEESIEEWNPFLTEKIKEEYRALSENFHDSDNLNERYKAAKNIVTFLLELEKTRPHPVDDTDIQRDQKFEQLLQKFYQMK